jgi:hypothetical protein
LQEQSLCTQWIHARPQNVCAMLHDAGLVAAALVVGGAIYLAIFFWVTVQRVNDLGPPKPPPEQH